MIRQEDRLDYYLALEQADKGDVEPFVLLVCEEMKRSLQFIVTVLKPKEK